MESIIDALKNRETEPGKTIGRLGITWDLFNTDPLTNVIVHQIIMGTDPARILGQILKGQIKLGDTINPLK